jgi:hypothetical protein
VLQDIGRRWQRTGTGVECEHLVVPVLQAALDWHAGRQRADRDGRGIVLLAAAPTEGHTLPLHAAAAALAERNVASYVFGNLPPEALTDAVAELHPIALLLWARSRRTADLPLLRSLRTAAPVTCAAGMGWPPRLPRSIAGTRDLASTVQLLASAA